MPLPIIKAVFAAKSAIELVSKHGGKVAHRNDPVATAAFLGQSLKELRDGWQDENTPYIFSLYNTFPNVIEVKVLMMLTTKNMGLNTKGMSFFDTLKTIVSELDEKGYSEYGTEIRNTLEWRDGFFSREDVQQILQKSEIDLSKPKSLKDSFRFTKNLTTWVTNEAKRLDALMNAAKKPAPKNDNQPPKRQGRGGPGR